MDRSALNTVACYLGNDPIQFTNPDQRFPDQTTILVIQGVWFENIYLNTII